MVASRGPGNALILSDLFVTCGAPDDACRAWLVEHLVDTLICVDGAEPDIDAANRAGLRVLHLPCTYDGIPEAVTLAITKAALEAQARGTRVATHCHHGKHRSPAAAATAMRALGASVHESEAALALAGTSSGYPGLWRDVREQEFIPLDARASLDAVALAWNTAVPPAELVRLMNEMERRLDAMSLSVARGALPSAADAGALADALRLCGDEGRGRAEGMSSDLGALALQAQALEDLLTATRAADSMDDEVAASAAAGAAARADARADAAAALASIRAGCASCHAVHRDR